jgi:hypothetical protein
MIAGTVVVLVSVVNAIAHRMDKFSLAAMIASILGLVAILAVHFPLID